MFYPIIRQFLFKLPPELAHEISLPLLDIVQHFDLVKALLYAVPQVPCKVMGLEFSNPVGLAAGMDKDGNYIDGFGMLGFGFIEVGTVTPRPQRGNPSPRLFRLPAAKALINRMGFNNHGVDELVKQVRRARFQGIIGVNIGKNRDTPLANAHDDYLYCLKKVYPVADYVAINISSPNTPGLRQLHQPEELKRLLTQLKATQKSLEVKHVKYVPLVVKISPDITTEELATIAEQLLEYEIDGVIATNTTVSRTGVEGLAHATETGGLSGVPLLARSTEIVRQLSVLLEGKIPIIASGGIMSAHDAQEKLQAGASLIQVYTGLIYQGPNLVKEIVQSLKRVALD